MTQVRAKKHLGQHFLKDLEVARRIADSLALDGRTSVLEIGPGMGVLTQFLLQNPDIDLTAVELDSESVVYLNQHYPHLKVVEADFLKMDLKNLFPEKFCIIGNLPYNISSQIFFKMLDHKDQIPCLVGMIQKEVAERMAAREGSKTYGILSVLMPHSRALARRRSLTSVMSTFLAPRAMQNWAMRLPMVPAPLTTTFLPFTSVRLLAWAPTAEGSIMAP
jgi:16S rRNA (adenine1518-N6/adenine1519-N6)-dimethyltransferase